MSTVSSEPPAINERPTGVRHMVVAVATMMSLLLYLDRFAVGIASEYIREDLRMTQTQMSWFLSAFFWSYALCQVPAGWSADRFGARRMLTIYILAWSVFTGLLGVAHLVFLVLYLRLFCGISQAGAYPTAGGLIRVWFPVSGRGIASSIVALGGRAGGVLAPLLTAWLIILFGSGVDPAILTDRQIVNQKSFLAAFQTKEGEPRTKLVERLVYRFSPEVQQRLWQESADADDELKQLKAKELENKTKGGSFDVRDWIPTVPVQKKPEPWFESLLAELAKTISDPGLLDEIDLSALKLTPEAAKLVQLRDSGESLSDSEKITLNRLAIEASFPGSLMKMRGTGWRTTMVLYGIAGLIVAIVFYVVARDLPAQHPRCNPAERVLIEGEATSVSAPVENPPFPLVPMLTSLSLWGNSMMQAFTNIGWVFVVTWLPRYLDKVHGVPLSGQAIMTAIPTAAGILGMYLGGWWTDRATQFGGRKWGRRLPILATRFSAGLGYAICLMLGLCFTPGVSNSWLPWGYVCALCLMAFSVDMGNPAVWAYAQDVGGKYTGSVLGWANMWGNLGAAAAPLIYDRVLGETPTIGQWNVMFAVCMIAFVLSAACSLVMDSTKSLGQQES